MKKLFLFLVSITTGAAVVIFGYLWDAPRNSQFLKPFFPKTLFSVENAPSQTLSGKIASMSGSVAWQSRTADYATLINSPVKLQQGEAISTYENGKATINFPAIGNMTFSPNTQVNFIQTLPANFVVEQKQGISTYTKNGNIPVSIRALDLLINLEEGNCTVSVDKDSANITVTVNSGSIKVAFNDINNNTNIVTINEGEQYLFNNNTKMGNVEFL
jgi:hypothetical protein